MKILTVALVATLMMTACSSSDSSKKPVAENDDVRPDGQAMTINSTNYEQLLKSAISVLNITSIDQARVRANSHVAQLVVSDAKVVAGGAAFEGLELASQNDLENADIRLEYTCNAEGSLTSVYHDFGSSGIRRRNVVFNQCLIDDVQRDGQYQFKSDGSRSANIETFTAYSARLDGSESVLSGVWESAYSFVPGAKDHSWKDAAFTSTGTPDDMNVTGLNWRRTGNDFASLAPSSVRGFVVNTEGSTVLVRQVSYSADLTSDFEFSNAATNEQLVQASVSLSFVGDYFEWDEPGYPVSDLGSPLTLSPTIDFGSDVNVVENLPKDNEAQWQSGTLTLTAEDGSTVSLSPSIDDKSLVTIELSDSDEIETRAWVDGFAINCPSVIEGCGVEDFK